MPRPTLSSPPPADTSFLHAARTRRHPSSPEALAAVEAAPAAPPEPAPPRIPLVGVPDRLRAFAGLATWVDLWDTELSAAEQARRAAACGAQAVFVQSARFNSPDDIHDPARLAELIDTARELGLKVMVWYIPDFVDVERDLRRSQAAIAFTTPRGNRADAFGLDIELDDVPDIAERNHRLLAISAALRAWTGPEYPLAAIVLPPLQLDLNSKWWPSFPFAELRPFYDVYIPMSYSTYRGVDPEMTYFWNIHNVLQLRERTGDGALPIHLAGGIADRLHAVDQFVRAAAEGLVIGGSMYDLHTTPAEAWPTLQMLRVD